MSLLNVFELASQGMTAQRLRLEASTSNLANSSTTRTAEGGPYRRRDVVLEAIKIDRSPSSFAAMLESLGSSSNFGDSIFSSAAASAQSQPVDDSAALGVRATALIDQTGEGIKRYDPEHPDADASGYVTMPDVDPLEETVNMLSAARSFEANATAFNVAKELIRASLKLGDA